MFLPAELYSLFSATACNAVIVEPSQGVGDGEKALKHGESIAAKICTRKYSGSRENIVVVATLQKSARGNIVPAKIIYLSGCGESSRRRGELATLPVQRYY